MKKKQNKKEFDRQEEINTERRKRKLRHEEERRSKLRREDREERVRSWSSWW